jgi:putative ABC transport system permease protein
MERLARGIKLGMKSLALHKLRSSLTVLGIVFGVAAVISMLAVGEGSSRDAQERIQQLGATNIIIRSVKPTIETLAAGGRPTWILNYGLTYEDYDRILDTVPTIVKALPVREVKKEVRHYDRALEGRVVGTTEGYDEFNRLELARGRFLTAADDDKVANCAVLGYETAQTLFPIEDPVGQLIQLGSNYYSVVGVMRERSSSGAIGGSMAGQSFNRDVYIPLSTCKLRFGERIVSFGSGSFSAEETQLSQITIQVASLSQVLPSQAIVAGAVMPWHTKKNDVEIIVPYDLLLQAQHTARQYSIILGTIAGISLLVGGIGIMNIMLATVTERTREIGIRRALGAKRKDITQQFLIETIVLSGVGGLLGVSLGFTIPQVIVFFIPNQPVIVTPQSVLLAFGISVGVGVLFGLYPARRASMMDPIEALRHE